MSFSGAVDSRNVAGDRWDDEIRVELKRMDVFLRLVSVHFLASDYIRDVKLPNALEREEKGGRNCATRVVSD